MTDADQITHLKAQLAEANEAIRELNERASSHLRASQDTIQALKLELDQTKAKLRHVRHYQVLMEADAKSKEDRNVINAFLEHINPDYIACDKIETVFQWGDGNLAASIDASHDTVNQAATERFRFENDEWVNISTP